MPSGYEVLGSNQPSVSESMFKLAQYRQQQQKQKQEDEDRDEARQERIQARQDRNSEYINNRYGFDKFSTGISSLDNVISQQIPDIQQKALQIANNSNMSEAMAYLSSATAQLANIHKYATTKAALENQYINNIVKQDPNIDEAKLRSDVNYGLNNMFLSKDGNFINPNSLSYGDLDNSIAQGYIQNNLGRYARNASSLIKDIAGQKVEPTTSSSFNGRGGGDKITTYLDPFHDAAEYVGSGKFKGGNYKNVNVHTENILENPNDPHSRIIKVLPIKDMDYLYAMSPSAKSSIAYLYNKAISNPKSSIYTDESSPIKGMYGQQLHPLNIDLANRWIARNLVDANSPARASAEAKEDRLPSIHVNVNGGNSQDTPYTDYFSKIKNGVSNLGDYGPELQSIILKTQPTNINQENTILYKDDNGNVKLIKKKKEGGYDIYDQPLATIRSEDINPKLATGKGKVAAIKDSQRENGSNNFSGVGAASKITNKEFISSPTTPKQSFLNPFQ